MITSPHDPLVSILIPAYKARWFEEALCSALAQDYPHTEILVFDNCPTEAICQICKRYPRVHYWRNPNRRMQNIIDLACASKGRYIKYLFDDDLLEPTCVSALVSAMAFAPLAKMAFSLSWQIDEAGMRQEIRFCDPHLSGLLHALDGNQLCRHFAKEGNCIGEFSTVLLEGAWLREHPAHLYQGALSQNHYTGLVDMICFMNAAAGRPVAFVNSPLSAFRQNSESNSNPEKNPDFLHVVTDHLLIIEEGRQYGLLSDEDLLSAKKHYNRFVIRLSKQYPSLAKDILPTRFADDLFPDYQTYVEYENLLKSGKHKEGIDLLLTLAEQDSPYWKVYAALAHFAEESGEDDLASFYYAKAKERPPLPDKEDKAYLKLLFKRGKKAEAISCLRDSQSAFPQDVEAQNLI